MRASTDTHTHTLGYTKMLIGFIPPNNEFHDK